jgi:hypothetical protein
VILTALVPGATPEGFATTGDPMFNRLWTLLGAPCVDVTGLSENELPPGIQISAAPAAIARRSKRRCLWSGLSRARWAGEERI